MQKKSKNTTRFVGFVASSIDGRISPSSTSSQKWTSKEDWNFFQDALSRMDAVVVGRNTYEVAKRSLQRRNTFVLTSKVAKIEKEGNVTFVNPRKNNLAKIFREYKTVGVLGGSFAYQTMLEKGFFDEIHVTIEPLIFGRGVQMFVGSRATTKLRLTSLRRLNARGTLLLRYTILHT